MRRPGRAAQQALEAARAYLARGWCPMAVPPRSKARRRPWRHLQTRRPTLEEVERDFGAEDGDANVALICGTVSGGLVILDVDGREAEAKVRSLDLPPTRTARAVRGPHLYWRTSDRVATRRLALGDGSALELRGEGSYVLAPPSVHPSGLRYAFEDPDVPLAELPAGVLTLFSTGGTNERPAADRADPPERWLRLVESNPRTRAAWEGRGDHPDRTGSGRDMFLAHELRRCSFGPEEARRILREAPYPVEGGRTERYLDLTLAKAYQAGRKRQLPAYGIAPAAPVDSGAWARLTPAAKALYYVLLVRRMRPSGKIVWSAEKLARDAGIHVNSIGPAAAQLEEEGLVTRKRVAGSRMEYHVPLISPQESTGVSQAPAEEGVPQATAGLDPTPGNSGGETNRATPRIYGGEPVMVHEIGGGPGPAPPATEALPGGEREGKGESGGAVALISMRLVPQHLPDGTVVVRRRCSDGSVVPIWRGTVGEWMSWRPPEVLRDESRRGEWPKVEG